MKVPHRPGPAAHVGCYRWNAQHPGVGVKFAGESPSKIAMENWMGFIFFPVTRKRLIENIGTWKILRLVEVAICWLSKPELGLIVSQD